MTPDGVVAIRPEPSAEKDLTWVEEIAALLPEESRLGWYRNVQPWLRMLPPEDEIAHLAYSMGYLALLTRSTPALIIEERAKLTALLQRHSDDVIGAVKTTDDYHRKLNDRLKKLPSEIAQGLSPKALATEIADGVREQFLQSGIPEAGRLLKEQGDRLRQLAADQDRARAELRQHMKDSQSHVTWVLNSVTAAADSRNSGSACYRSDGGVPPAGKQRNSGHSARPPVDCYATSVRALGEDVRHAGYRWNR